MAAHTTKGSLRLLMAQINPTVGAVADNARRMIQLIQQYQASHDLIIFPELALTGYPIEDLVFRESFMQEVETALETIQQCTESCHVVIGHPSRHQTQRFNSASVFYQKHLIIQYHKHHLPNYGVFDEARYFTAGKLQACTFDIHGYKLGLIICEDLWQPGPAEAVLQAEADGLIIINASPFVKQKHEQRLLKLRHYTKNQRPAFYVNQIGGQDELVFDGRSLVLNQKGEIYAEAPAFAESILSMHYQDETFTHLSIQTLDTENLPLLTHHKEEPDLIYQALCCGLRDYVNKNKFPGVLLGLSGGVDSALTLALAVDALGPSRVTAVYMPSRYSATMSQEDALTQIETLGVKHLILPIENAFEALLDTLNPVLSNHTPDITEENMQARIRAILLMAISNKNNLMLLSTSNKSEAAVGYTTLYGDMCGGFSVLKDVYKTMVYTLSRYRNSLSPVIPERVLTRAPSAELAFNQKDQDRLPEYSLLDAILEGYIEEQMDASTLIAKGYPKETVLRVIELIVRNEYKRYQSPPGVKITSRAFGRDWRYPLTNRLQIQSNPLTWGKS